MKHMIRRLIDMRHVMVKIHEDHVESVFWDNATSLFYPMAPREGLKEFRDIARAHGYGHDAMLYGLEHDMTHHFLAHALNAPYSRVVRHDALKDMEEVRKHDPALPWPWQMDHEEHLVNRLQVYTWKGEPDPYGCLDRIWGEDLPKIADWLRHFLRPKVYARPKFQHPAPGPIPGFIYGRDLQ